MDKIATENLFLLEFLVDSITLDPSCDCDDNGEGEKCVSFQFLDNAPLDVCEADFNPQRRYNSKCPKDTNVKSGKSCLFSLSPDQAEEAMNKLDIFVTIINKMPADYIPQSIDIGSALISIANLFEELISSITDATGEEGNNTPTAKTMKDDFDITSPSGDICGKIGIYIRMSCFGKLIVTQFQMNLQDKSVLFKDKEGKSLYRYKKAGKKSKRGEKEECTPKSILSNKSKMDSCSCNVRSTPSAPPPSDVTRDDTVCIETCPFRPCLQLSGQTDTDPGADLTDYAGNDAGTGKRINGTSSKIGGNASRTGGVSHKSAGSRTGAINDGFPGGGPPGMGYPPDGIPGTGCNSAPFPGMGYPGVPNQQAMGYPGAGAPMGFQGMNGSGMGVPGMGAPGMGAPGMGAPGMGPPGMNGAGMGDVPCMECGRLPNPPCFQPAPFGGNAAFGGVGAFAGNVGYGGGAFAGAAPAFGNVFPFGGGVSAVAPGLAPCSECQPCPYGDETEIDDSCTCHKDDVPDGNYQEIGATMGGNSLTIRVHKDKGKVETVDENTTESCVCGAGRNNVDVNMQPGVQQRGKEYPFQFKMGQQGQPGGGGGNVVVNPPTCTAANGAKVTEFSDPNKELFVLRIGKKSEGVDKKQNLELELCTPKAPELKPIPQKVSVDTQYDPKDAGPPGGKKGKGGKGKGGKDKKKKK